MVEKEKLHSPANLLKQKPPSQEVHMIDLDVNHEKGYAMGELEKATIKMKKGSEDLFKNLS